MKQFALGVIHVIYIVYVVRFFNGLIVSFLYVVRCLQAMMNGKMVSISYLKV